MGCDIHLYVERREWRQPSDRAILDVLQDALLENRPASIIAGLRAQLSPGTWQYVRPAPRDLEKYPRDAESVWGRAYYGPGGCMRETDEGDTYDGACPHWYNNRNYRLFAVLAGVRASDDDPEPISEPRGFPADVSELVAEHHSGDHSASWLTVEEILTWPGWDRKRAREGFVPLQVPDMDYVRYTQGSTFEDRLASGAHARGEQPQIWYRDRGDTEGRVVEPDEAIAIVSGNASRWAAGQPHNVKVYVHERWQGGTRDDCRDFLAFVDEFLRPLGEPEDVRIVFEFDN